MKINTFEFEDKTRGWKLEKTSFDRFNLLVGASGVGKTQTLKAINTLKDIASGEEVNEVKWKLDFTSTKGNHFVWEGEFETVKTHPLDIVPIPNTYQIKYEKIFQNNKLIIERNQDNVIFQSKRFPLKIDRSKSFLKHLEEVFIIEMKKEFRKIYISDYIKFQQNVEFVNLIYDENILQKYNNIEKISNSDWNIEMKLLLIYHNKLDAFKKVKKSFIDIFPQVEDIKVQELETSYYDEFAPSIFFTINIKEKGINEWISQKDISSGMLRTLMHISELYLAAEGTVFLIDEFENSLGINCLEDITSEIINSRRSLQFIITSHHPYIINNIPFQHWKLLTRQGATVQTHTMNKFNFGKSKHENFKQLLQLEAYQTGSLNES